MDDRREVAVCGRPSGGRAACRSGRRKSSIPVVAREDTATGDLKYIYLLDEMFPMAKHILVPTDGSEQADRAFEFAVETFPDAELTVLYVLDPPEAGYLTGRERGTQDPDSTFRKRVAEATAFLDEYVEQGETAGVSVTADHAIADERGQESRSIVRYAEDADVDLVVMGSHGRSGVSRVLLGSVAERVVRRASVPVTVVR